MGSDYPFGPHGPRSSPQQVTPNPTQLSPPPPPPSNAGWQPPVSTPGSWGGGGPVYSGDFSGGRKSYFLAIMLTAVFGPLGLFYASWKGALVVLLLLFGVPVSLAMLGVAPFFQPYAGPFFVLEVPSIMDRMWSISVICSVIWSVIAVRSFNKNV